MADLGCGTGYITIPLAPLVTKVYAIDAQQTMLDRLVEHVPEGYGGRVESRAGGAASPALADSSIDRAVMVNVIHEIDDLPLLHSELQQVPEGRWKVEHSGLPTTGDQLRTASGRG